MTTDAIRITLTTAQRSALECFEPDEDDAIAWAELNFDGRRVTATPAAYSLIFEASNIEGEAAEYWSRRGETDLARQARGASEALHNLCKKMRLRCPASFSLRTPGAEARTTARRRMTA